MHLKKRVYVKINIYELDFSVQNNFLFELSPLTNMELVIMNKERYYQTIRENGSEISEEKKQKLWERMEPESTDRVYLLIDQKHHIIGFYSVSHGENYDEEINYLFKRQQGKVFLFDAYTFKVHRKKGAQTLATKKILQKVKEDGYRAAIVMIDEENEYSKRATLKFGFKKCGEVYHVNLGVVKKNFARNTNLNRNDG